MKYIFWTRPGNTGNGVFEDEDNPQYVSIVSNNIYAKFGTATSNIVEAI